MIELTITWHINFLLPLRLFALYRAQWCPANIVQITKHIHKIGRLHLHHCHGVIIGVGHKKSFNLFLPVILLSDYQQYTQQIYCNSDIGHLILHLKSLLGAKVVSLTE